MSDIEKIAKLIADLDVNDLVQRIQIVALQGAIKGLFKAREPKMSEPVCGEDGYVCEEEGCQECCPHDDHDHGICLGCGKDRYDHFVGVAESAFEGDR